VTESNRQVREGDVIEFTLRGERRTAVAMLLTADDVVFARPLQRVTAQPGATLGPRGRTRVQARSQPHRHRGLTASPDQADLKGTTHEAFIHEASAGTAATPAAASINCQVARRSRWSVVGATGRSRARR
jgi:hypothetical protein